MTPNSTPSDGLDTLLTEWKVDGALPASLQREVWAHIGAGEIAPACWERLALLVLRPHAIAATVVLSALFGSSLALMLKPKPTVDPHDAYVQSITPFSSLRLAAR